MQFVVNEFFTIYDEVSVFSDIFITYNNFFPRFYCLTLRFPLQAV